VLDTNVVVAAMRSPTGASAALLMAARRSELTMLANVALALEYEATCQLAEHRLAAGLDLHQVGIFIDAALSRPPANGRGMDYVPGIRAAEARYGGKIEADG
jgi:predicted nucleic acid-binding protein